jgi:hypothetical protein
MESLSQLVKLFLVNGFAWDGNAALVSQDGGTNAEFCLTLISPATIWGGQSLQLQRAKIRNDYV